MKGNRSMRFVTIGILVVVAVVCGGCGKVKPTQARAALDNTIAPEHLRAAATVLIEEAATQTELIIREDDRRKAEQRIDRAKLAVAKSVSSQPELKAATPVDWRLPAQSIDATRAQQTVARCRPESAAADATWLAEALDGDHSANAFDQLLEKCRKLNVRMQPNYRQETFPILSSQPPPTSDLEYDADYRLIATAEYAARKFGRKEGESIAMLHKDLSLRTEGFARVGVARFRLGDSEGGTESLRRARGMASQCPSHDYLDANRYVLTAMYEMGQAEEANKLAGILKWDSYAINKIVKSAEDSVKDESSLRPTFSFEQYHEACNAAERCARRGDLNGAIAIVDHVAHSPAERGQMLHSICLAGRTLANVTTVRNRLKDLGSEAIRSAPSRTEALERWLVLADVTVAFYDIGGACDPDGAQFAEQLDDLAKPLLASVTGLPPSSSSNIHTRRSGVYLAAGDLTQAKSELLKVPQNERFNCYAALITECLRRQAIDAAIELGTPAGTIPDYLYGFVAEAQLDNHDIDGALRTATMPSSNDERLRIYGNVVAELTRIGDHERAVKTASSLEDPRDRIIILCDGAEAALLKRKRTWSN